MEIPTGVSLIVLTRRHFFTFRNSPETLAVATKKSVNWPEKWCFRSEMEKNSSTPKGEMQKQFQPTSEKPL